MKSSAAIEQIVRELCDMEPSLAGRKDELRRIVQALLEQQPANTFDKAFARRLRRQLLAADRPSLSPIKTLMSFITSARLTYGLSGALVALVFMLPVMYLATTPARNLSSLSSSDLISSLTNRPVFTPQTSNAFGSLAVLAEASRSQSGGGFGGGGFPAPSPASDKIASEMVIDRPWYQPYKFVYRGDTLTVDEASLEVHKRVKRLNSSDIARIASGLGGELVNIGSFSNPQVRSIDLYEDRAAGYNIGINFFEGTVYINPNYETWFAEQNAACARGNCPPPLSIGEAIPDSEAISIATAFLAQHGIDVSTYGAPVMDNQWRLAYDQAVDKSLVYIPDTVGVVFPLQLQGQDVRDSGGNLYGLRVEIHQREKKVFGVWNLNVQRYESSSYPTEQDTSRIIKLAERGGLYGWWGAEEAPDAKEIALGTPTHTLMQFLHYTNGVNEELYVPALVFPVLDAPQDYYGQRSIVVPVIKEILDSYEQQVVMPLGIGGGAMLKETSSIAPFPPTIDPATAPSAPASEPKQ